MKHIKKILWKLLFVSAMLILTINTVSAFQNIDTEKERLQWHLDRTENILRKVDTSNLNQNQKENRTKMLDLLETYTKEWKFPNNDTFPWEYVPFFRWSNGNLCAVWYLMYSDPEYKDYVDTVVKTNNNVQVMDIKNDTVFNSWLEKYGFNQLEAAMIQPSYYRPSVFERYFEKFFTFWFFLSVTSFVIIWIFRRKYIYDIFLKISFFTWITIIALISMDYFPSIDLWYEIIEILWIWLIIPAIAFIIWIWRQRKNLDIYLKILLIIVIIFILCSLIQIFWRDIFPFLYGESWSIWGGSKRFKGF